MNRIIKKSVSTVLQKKSKFFIKHVTMFLEMQQLKKKSAHMELAI